MITRTYFTPTQRKLAVACALYHVEAFLARRALTGSEHREEQLRLRAQFRQSWQAAIAIMRRDGAKSRRRP